MTNGTKNVFLYIYRKVKAYRNRKRMNIWSSVASAKMEANCCAATTVHLHIIHTVSILLSKIFQTETGTVHDVL